MDGDHDYWFSLLDQAVRDVPTLLDTPGWKSKFVDYDKPHVMRIYRDDWVPGIRLCLHIIQKCSMDEALFHPHDWPSAMHIVQGMYRQELAYGAGAEIPTVTTGLMELGGGSRYVMRTMDEWHRVAPLTDDVMTIMLMGKPWHRAWVPKPTGVLRDLTPTEIESMKSRFRHALTIP